MVSSSDDCQLLDDSSVISPDNRNICNNVYVPNMNLSVRDCLNNMGQGCMNNCYTKLENHPKINELHSEFEIKCSNYRLNICTLCKHITLCNKIFKMVYVVNVLERK